MELTGFDVYRIYVALKTHFNSDKYDFFKLKGRIRATPESYKRRKDRYFFEKLAKRFSGPNSHMLMDLFIHHFDKDPAAYVGDFHKALITDEVRLAGQAFYEGH